MRDIVLVNVLLEQWGITFCRPLARRWLHNGRQTVVCVKCCDACMNHCNSLSLSSFVRCNSAAAPYSDKISSYFKTPSMIQNCEYESIRLGKKS